MLYSFGLCCLYGLLSLVCLRGLCGLCVLLDLLCLVGLFVLVYGFLMATFVIVLFCSCDYAFVLLYDDGFSCFGWLFHSVSHWCLWFYVMITRVVRFCCLGSIDLWMC